MRRRLIAGNWKMNLTHLEAIGLVQKLAFSLSAAQLGAVEVVVLPTYIAIRSVQTLIDADRIPIGYGAQDVSPHASGAYTGEISAAMLAKLGCTYVVVGHSERRQYHHEDDGLINAKLAAGLEQGLRPILCVGEGLDVRQQGGQLAHCVAQLDGALRGRAAAELAELVVAYEPVWAIGTGQVATPQDAQEVCAAVRARLGELYSADVGAATRILYGGSVKASNTPGILAEPDVDGALVGGASLDAEEFARICAVAAQPDAAG